MHCSTENWEKGTHWAEALRKQLSSHLLFVDFKTTIQIPVLRVLGKMLQFKTAGHPYCHVLPCAAAEPGRGTGRKGQISCGCCQGALAGAGQCVSVLGGICLSADGWE